MKKYIQNLQREVRLWEQYVLKRWSLSLACNLLLLLFVTRRVSYILFTFLMGTWCAYITHPNSFSINFPFPPSPFHLPWSPFYCLYMLITHNVSFGEVDIFKRIFIHLWLAPHYKYRQHTYYVCLVTHTEGHRHADTHTSHTCAPQAGLLIPPPSRLISQAPLAKLLILQELCFPHEV